MAPTTLLGDFLRARRAGLTPEEVGIIDSFGIRRVPGLRREEVARLASISTDYYTRLEQGRIKPSPEVVLAVARALRLDNDQTEYLTQIANLFPHPVVPSSPTVQTQRLPQLQVLIDDFSSIPAFAIGPRTEIIAWNAMGAALITDFQAIPEEERYYIRLLITDPRMRLLYTDWEDVTRLAVEQLRRLNATTPNDPELRRLVAELSVEDDDFTRWWNSHEVAPRTGGTKLLRHPLVGELELEWSALTWNADPEVQIIAWTATPGSASRERLARLRTLV
jgi:DNA-binding protein